MNLKNILPGLIFCSGLGITLNIDSALSFFSGSLLMLLACMIWIKRGEQQQKQCEESNKHI